MSPFLERKSKIPFGVKFVRVDNKIYYSDKNQPLEIAREKHSQLALKAGAQTGSSGKPIVSDGGLLRIFRGNLEIQGSTSSCIIRGDEKEERSRTFNIVAQILGKK